MAEETTIWNEFIDPALMVYYIIKYMITKVTLFLFVYDRKVILPIDKPYDLHMRDHMIQIVKEIPYIREEA